MAIRLMRCWHCLKILPSDPTALQFVAHPNSAFDEFTCNCLKEPYPDIEEIDYGEIFDDSFAEED